MNSINIIDFENEISRNLNDVSCEIIHEWKTLFEIKEELFDFTNSNYNYKRML